MIRTFIGCAFCLAIAGCASAHGPLQTAVPAKLETRLAAHVKYLASDNLEGRGSGSNGERIAANYIADQFRDAGLRFGRGGWEQAFSFLAVGGPQAFQRLSSRNVYGILPGADLSKEAIVVGAHFDGQGTTGQAAFGRLGEKSAREDRIWNSASDNATSIAALIEIARELARSERRLKRSIVFVAFSGEENRLNGSLQFVRDF